MKKILFIVCSFLCCATYSFSQDVVVGNTTLTQSDLVTGIQVPWEILWGPDDHIWVTERRGRVLRIDPATGSFTTVLNHQSEVESGGEPGMLGMALHPDFLNTPLVYIVYNYGQGFSVSERLVSFRWDGTNLTDEVILIDDIPGGGIHNGSRLIISTDDKILMTTGDRGNADLSQDLNSLNGKTLRINLDGSIPDDNPMSGSYIYSYGHRNQQGLCHGPNGIIYSSEHGAQQSDEFNIIEPNRNYGWPNVQGACNTTSEMNFCNNFDVKEPLAEWSPCVAVNGIEYYDHPAIPEFQNSVLMAVLGGLSGGAQRISQLKMSEDGTEIVEEIEHFTNFGRLRDVCVNPHTGALYLATNGPSYPGSGPNRIVEYRNMDYVINDLEEVEHTQYIRIFPNPVRSNSRINFSENFIGKTYEIISFKGQVVDSGTIQDNLMDIKTKKLATGTYYIKATNEVGTVTRVFVIQ